jgi:hypothetical protein
MNKRGALEYNSVQIPIKSYNDRFWGDWGMMWQYERVMIWGVGWEYGKG